MIHLQNKVSVQCRGHYCFIAVDKIHEKPLHFKGCISANEQGDNKIQVRLILTQEWKAGV